KHTFSHRLMILDVEDNGYEGWNEVDRPGTCWTVKKQVIPPSVDRATFNGFWNYIEKRAPGWRIAVYSSHGGWNSIFCDSTCGPNAKLTGTLEITADWGRGCQNPAPRGWIQPKGKCALNRPSFFGGIDTSSPCAFGWQWHGGASDFDQVN